MHFVKMYSANWCHDCKAMVAFLDNHNVPYQVINVDNNAKAIETLKNLCDGKKIIPTLEVEGRVFINPSIDDLGKYLFET